MSKAGNSEAAALGKAVMAFLASLGHEAALWEGFRKNEPIPAQTDFVIALGGDGTLLGLGRRLAGANIPVFGINFGRIGHLCAASRDAWQAKLVKVLQDGGKPAPEFLALRWRLERSGRREADGVAINDIVIGRDRLARLICAHVSVNGEGPGQIRGDGIIFCTPLGSSAYNFSAGGPLLQLSLNVICLTPVCAFLANSSSRVFSGESAIMVVLEPSSADCYLTIDGQEGWKLRSGDKIWITGWAGAVSYFLDEAGTGCF